MNNQFRNKEKLEEQEETPTEQLQAPAAEIKEKK